MVVCFGGIMFQFLQWLNGAVWGVPALVLILGVGVYLSLRTGFVQLTLFPRAMKLFACRLRQTGSEDGTVRYGTGFIIAEEGYVLCSSNLVQENTAFRIYQESFGYNAALAGVQKELGLALLKLDGAYGLTYVSAGNFTFVERGETLTAVGAVYGKEFLGTALSGNVAALDTVIRTGKGNLPISVPVAYLSVPPNASLWGAPCIDEAGNTVGICTDAIESPYGSLTAVVSINAVYTLVNEMLGSGVA